MVVSHLVQVGALNFELEFVLFCTIDIDIVSLFQFYCYCTLHGMDMYVQVPLFLQPFFALLFSNNNNLL
jgi:hypothetical protein